MISCYLACSAVLDDSKHGYTWSGRCHHCLHSLQGQVCQHCPQQIPGSLACSSAWPDTLAASCQGTCYMAAHLAVQHHDTHLLLVEVQHARGLTSHSLPYVDRNQQSGACSGPAQAGSSEWPQQTLDLCCMRITVSDVKPLHPSLR